MGFLAILPEARSLLRMIERSTSTPDVAKSLCNSLLVFQGLLMLFLIIILLSWDVVFLFLPHLPPRWMLIPPSSSVAFTILPTVDLDMPNRSTICLIDKPLCCLSATILGSQPFYDLVPLGQNVLQRLPFLAGSDNFELCHLKSCLGCTVIAAYNQLQPDKLNLKLHKTNIKLCFEELIDIFLKPNFIPNRRNFTTKFDFYFLIKSGQTNKKLCLIPVFLTN